MKKIIISMLLSIFLIVMGIFTYAQMTGNYTIDPNCNARPNERPSYTCFWRNIPENPSLVTYICWSQIGECRNTQLVGNVTRVETQEEQLLLIETHIVTRQQTNRELFRKSTQPITTGRFTLG